MKHQLSINFFDHHLSDLSSSSLYEVEISCGAANATGESSESTKCDCMAKKPSTKTGPSLLNEAKELAALEIEWNLTERAR